MIFLNRRSRTAHCLVVKGFASRSLARSVKPCLQQCRDADNAPGNEALSEQRGSGGQNTKSVNSLIKRSMRRYSHCRSRTSNR